MWTPYYCKLPLALSLAAAACYLISCHAQSIGPLDEPLNLSEPQRHPHEGFSPTASSSNVAQDRWSMVAAMRDGGQHTAGSGRLAARRNAMFEWNVNLDSLGHYQLNWNVHYRKNRISFALEINTNESGFKLGSDIFALGFSERGELHSSDFCLIWFDLSHRVHLQDARTDASNVLHLVESSRSVCRLAQGAGGQGELHAAEPEPSIAELESDPLDSNSEDIDREKEEQEQEAHPRGHGPASESNFEVLFERPLEVCKRGNIDYYAIDNGTTHLVWFALKGPLLALDSLNLTNYLLETAADAKQQTSEQQHASQTTTSTATGGDKSKARARPAFEFGLRRAQLVASKPMRASSHDPAARTLDIRMDRYEVPARETTYWCKLFKLPERFERRRFHVTSYEAAIEPGMEHVVHHMELFNCANLSPNQRANLERLYRSQGGWAGECAADSRPRATESCRRVILAWALGAKPLVYPEQVGQSIGGRDYSPFVVLEVHYNNVGRARGLVDSSGLRFHYTPRLRPFDAGILEVGLEYTDKNSIPPGLVAPLAGHCVSECTRVAIAAAARGEDRLLSAGHSHSLHSRAPAESQDYERHSGETINKDSRQTRQQQQQHEEGGIYIFAAQMHTHLTGVASWTEHVRGGRLLGELQRDDHYSPHFQEIRLLPRQVRVAPGDALIHYCLYDTRLRDNITLGGFATADEMCVTYLHYYPRVDLEVCKSSVDSSALGGYFDQLARDEAQETRGVRGPAAQSTGAAARLAARGAEPKSVSENYRSIEWSPRRSRELIEFYHGAPLSVQCNRSDGRRWPGFWEGQEPTRLQREPALELGPSGGGGQHTGPEPPLNSFDYYKQPSARELLAYRGRGHRARHLRCQRASASG